MARPVRSTTGVGAESESGAGGPATAPRASAPVRRPGGSLGALLGPAFVAAVAYVDPGNIAANLTAGARHGYLLLWVLVAANAIAVLVQYLSAKIGAVTGRSLAQLVGAHASRPLRLLYCLQGELVAIATDIAEVIGGALALRILFGVPLVLGGVIVGAVSLLLLALRSRAGARAFERVVLGLLLVITAGFLAGLAVDPPSPSSLAAGLVPRFDGPGTVVLAASMLGATVMPHAIYLHSGLVVDRFGPPSDGASTRRILWAARWDVVLSLALAGTVNIAMLVLAAEALPGIPGTDTIDGAQAAIQRASGPVVGTLFAIGLLVSGLASASVGAHAGASLLADLLRVRIPLLVQRLVTLVPALVVLALGVDPTAALVASQVVLSLGIPFALVPLVVLSRRRAVMGEFTLGAPMTALAALAAAAIIVIDAALVALTAAGTA